MSEPRDSQQQPGNLATFSDANSSFSNEIQNEIMANDVNRNDSFDEETRHNGGVPEATTSDAMLGKDDLWPTDAELFSSYSPFQGSTINEDLNLGNMLEDSSWSPQSVKQLHKCTTMPELQDNFEYLLGSMSPFGNFPTYPNTSLDSKETSPGISVGICSQFSNSPGNIPMAAATESENEQWPNPTVLCSGKDWTNLFNLSFRCTKKKMEAIRQSVFEATNDALCFEEKDEDVVEMRLRVELRS